MDSNSHYGNKVFDLLLIIHHRGICVHCARDKLCLLFTGKLEKIGAHICLYKCACIFGASFRGILTMKESVMHHLVAKSNLHHVSKTKAHKCSCPELTQKDQEMESKIMYCMLKTVQLSKNMQQCCTSCFNFD